MRAMRAVESVIGAGKRPIRIGAHAAFRQDHVVLPFFIVLKHGKKAFIMRKTKIVCTIGPASSSEEVFAEMCKAGLNVARLNFSHGTHEEHQQKFDMIHKVRKALGLPIAIMLDTKGPEYRICTFKNKKILLQDGDAFTFTTRQVEGDGTIVGVSYAGLANDLSVGDTVLVNNGLVIFTVERIEGTEIHCRVVVGGELSDRKSMSFPHKVLEQVYLSEQDKDDLLFGIRNGIDFVAASFVSRRQDVLDVRNFLDANGGQDIEIIAKIENQTGIDNVEEICEVCSGIMIGRGVPDQEHGRRHLARDVLHGLRHWRKDDRGQLALRRDGPDGLALPRAGRHRRHGDERARVVPARALLGRPADLVRGDVYLDRRAVLQRPARGQEGPAPAQGRQHRHDCRQHQRRFRQHEPHQGRNDLTDKESPPGSGRVPEPANPPYACRHTEDCFLHIIQTRWRRMKLRRTHYSRYREYRSAPFRS